MKPDENNSIFELATNFINETSEHVFLTGKAGTGKTTFLRHIRANTHKRAVVAAPTGVAAINAGGITLHSLFQLPFEPYMPGFSINSSQKNRFRFSKAKLDLLRQLELLIIDEVSMLRADTLDAIDDTLRGIRRNPKPFGGIQILYIGDMFQLPPVAKEDEWNMLKEHYASTFFFHAKAFEKTKPVYLELKKVYRQSEESFVNLLNNVRNNCLTISDLETLNQRFHPNFSPSKGDNYITLTTHNYKADQINNKELLNLPGKESVFQGEVTGEFPDYSLPTDMQLRLKENAQIMFIKNDPNGNYYNGKIANISRILNNEQIYVYLPEKNSEILVTKETWKNVKYSLNKESGEVLEEELGSFVQYPLCLAWAVTIHKSQGLTFDKAIIDIGASFAAGQAYVALSRCTSLEGIILHSKIHPNCVFTDENAINFSKSEKEEAELQALFQTGKQKFWAERLLMYFDWKDMYQILREFEKLLEDKTSGEFHAAQTILAQSKKEVRELEDVSYKFRQQLGKLIEQEHQTNDVGILKDRCRKAVSYFHENVVEKILKPLQHYIQYFPNPKKAKTFYKNIISIEEDIILFLENMKRVRYNNIPFVDDLDLQIPERKDVFTTSKSNNKEITDKVKIKKEAKEKSPRPEKGATQQTTLTLFKEGKSIEEIAAIRTLAASTIEGHLASFIGMELSIEDFLTKKDLETIAPVVQPFLEATNPPFKLIFDRLDGKYSYGKIRMAFNHFLNKP